MKYHIDLSFEERVALSAIAIPRAITALQDAYNFYKSRGEGDKWGYQKDIDALRNLRERLNNLKPDFNDVIAGIADKMEDEFAGGYCE
jgi:hypothetical protein